MVVIVILIKNRRSSWMNHLVDRRMDFYKKENLIESVKIFEKEVDLKEIHCETITPLYSEDSLKFISNFYALFNNKPEINHDPQISTPEQNIIKGQFEEMISFTKFSCVPGVTFINQLVPKASQRALFYG